MSHSVNELTLFFKFKRFFKGWESVVVLMWIGQMKAILCHKSTMWVRPAWQLLISIQLTHYFVCHVQWTNVYNYDRSRKLRLVFSDEIATGGRGLLPPLQKLLSLKDAYFDLLLLGSLVCSVIGMLSRPFWYAATRFFFHFQNFIFVALYFSKMFGTLERSCSNRMWLRFLGVYM